jgi:hypothetical protein
MQLHQRAALVAAVLAVGQLQLPEPQELKTQAAAVVAQELQQVQETLRVALAAAALSASAISAHQSDRSRVPLTQPQKRVDTPSIPSLNPETW